MTVRVGVIGVGNIGQDHIRRLSRALSGASVVALSDIDSARAHTVAGGVLGARVFRTGQELIRSDDVDAILVASWGPTHEEFVLAAIETGKPVFCEKPLAPTIEACLRIVDAEVTCGRRLVQVGFMRRYEKSGDGTLGTPLLMHCAHRNASAPPHFTSDMLITDAAFHEIDLVRWLLDEEIAAARVLKPRRSGHSGDLEDPQLVILETAAGVLIDVEVFVNCGYGYDIRCEVVGESSSVSLGDGSDVILSRGGQHSGRVPSDWRERFERAYDTELQAWLDSVAAGVVSGPSAWDGYAATAVAETSLTTVESGERAMVQLEARPALYDTQHLISGSECGRQRRRVGLTVDEVSRRLKLHPETVRRWIRAGKLKAISLGSDRFGLRIRTSEIQRFLEGGEQEVKRAA